MKKIQIDVNRHDLVYVVKVIGFMSITEVFKFEDVLTNLINDGRVNIVLDLSELEYISSAGLGTIMGSIRHIQRLGGDLKIGGMTSAVKEIFETFGFTAIFATYATPKEAISSYKD